MKKVDWLKASLCLTCFACNCDSAVLVLQQVCSLVKLYLEQNQARAFFIWILIGPSEGDYIASGERAESLESSVRDTICHFLVKFGKVSRIETYKHLRRTNEVSSFATTARLAIIDDKGCFHFFWLLQPDLKLSLVTMLWILIYKCDNILESPANKVVGRIPCILIHK